jgi:hypothetical protein
VCIWRYRKVNGSNPFESDGGLWLWFVGICDVNTNKCLCVTEVWCGVCGVIK